MLVPVGIFDDHPDPRVLLLGGAEHQVAADLAHLVDAVVGPAAVAFGGNVGVALRGVEEEVVEDHFVEVARDQAHGAFAFGAVGGILIIEGAELAARAARGERDPARRLDALRLELALDRLELGVGRELRGRGTPRYRPCRSLSCDETRAKSRSNVAGSASRLVSLTVM